MKINEVIEIGDLISVSMDGWEDSKQFIVESAKNEFGEKIKCKNILPQDSPQEISFSHFQRVNTHFVDTSSLDNLKIN